MIKPTSNLADLYYELKKTKEAIKSIDRNLSPLIKIEKYYNKNIDKEGNLKKSIDIIGEEFNKPINFTVN